MWKTTTHLVNGVLCGERPALSRAITLLESSRTDHVEQAELLLDAVQQASKQQPFTVGICGPPGAGYKYLWIISLAEVCTKMPMSYLLPMLRSSRRKSTFLERLGTQLTSKGNHISVVAVDPSSSFSGGALLGDRCRMDNLSKDPLAFIRSCPTRGVLGGVARYTQSIVQLCGVSSNFVFVESVGIGQSEIEASHTVDLLVLLLSPAGGDELQGSKKGIVESADLIVINKADGPLEKHAKRTAMDYKAALRFTRKRSPYWDPVVLLCSSLKGEGGVEEVWTRCEEFREKATMNGELSRRRKAQGEYWMMKELERCLSEALKKDPNIIKLANRLKEEVGRGERSARNAGRCLAGLFHTTEQPQE